MNTTLTINQLLDQIMTSQQLKNDAALARELEVAAPVISKLRSGGLKMGCSMIVKLHLAFDIPVRDLQAVAA